MELFSLELTGFRRFYARTMLRTNGKLVALIGPNEAGKSSVLEALSSLNDDEPPPRGAMSRGSDSSEFSIKAKFLLSRQEAQSANLTWPRWLVIEKAIDGERTYDFEPPAPKRDEGPREVWGKEVISVTSSPQLLETILSEDDELFDGLTEIQRRIQDSDESLSQANLHTVREQLQIFRKRLPEDQFKYFSRLYKLWNDMIVAETAKTPWQVAIEAVEGEVPEFVIFDEDERELSSSYVIAQLREKIPTALQNLADVAELDFQKVFDAIDGNDRAKLSTLERHANDKLKESFSQNWRQSNIEVAFRLAVDQAEIHIFDEQREFSDLGERSDGLRQFVALLAFTSTRRFSKPVLLIDEAEQRLHYDAQADLVQMLARQKIAPKVIYTTHSAGCLPEDLGVGVRLVAPRGEPANRSLFINKYWAQGQPGVSPLLLGMGASTMAFFPTRKAIVVEGAADTILYPTMFREYLDLESLGFQFVPGLSNAGNDLAAIHGQGNGHVVYLVDGDPGGLALKAKLLSAGVVEDRIFVLKNADRSALEPEDYISKALLLSSINEILARHYPDVESIKSEEIPNVCRMANLERVFRERTNDRLPKVELAYEILDAVIDNPKISILEARRVRSFGTTVARIVASLG